MTAQWVAAPSFSLHAKKVSLSDLFLLHPHQNVLFLLLLFLICLGLLVWLFLFNEGGVGMGHLLELSCVCVCPCVYGLFNQANIILIIVFFSGGLEGWGVC